MGPLGELLLLRRRSKQPSLGSVASVLGEGGEETGQHRVGRIRSRGSWGRKPKGGSWKVGTP